MLNSFFTNFARILVFLSLVKRFTRGERSLEDSEFFDLNDVTGEFKLQDQTTLAKGNKLAILMFNISTIEDQDKYQLNSSTLAIEKCNKTLFPELTDNKTNTSSVLSFVVPFEHLLSCFTPDYVPILNVSACPNISNHNLSLSLSIPPEENSSRVTIRKAFLLLAAAINKCSNTSKDSLALEMRPDFLQGEAFSCGMPQRKCKSETLAPKSRIFGMVCSSLCEKRIPRASLNFTNLDTIMVDIEYPKTEAFGVYRIYGKIGGTKYFREIGFSLPNVQFLEPGRVLIELAVYTLQIKLGNAFSLYFVFDKQSNNFHRTFKVENIRVSPYTLEDIQNLPNSEEFLNISKYSSYSKRNTSIFAINNFLQILACILLGLVVGAILITAIYFYYVFRKSSNERYDIEEPIENAEIANETDAKEVEAKPDENMDLSFLEENNTSLEEPANTALTEAVEKKKNRALEKVIDDFDEESEMLREN